MKFLALAGNNLWQYINSAETLDFLISNPFLLIFLVIVLSSIKHSSYKNIWTTASINLLGTFFHESAHFLVGLILNAKPTSFTLFPKKENGYYVMGSVGFRNICWYNAIPSAMAPLLLIIVGYMFNSYFFANIPLSIWSYLAYILVESIIIENALPSKADFKVAFSSLQGVFLYGFILVAYLAYFLY